MSNARLCLLVMVALAVPGVGCTNVDGGGVDGGAVADGAVADGAVADRAVADGAVADGAVDGGGPTDAAPPESDAGASACPPLPPGGKVREWQDVMGSAWPQGTSNVNNIVVPDPGYLALRFATGDHVGTGRITDIENTTAAGIRTGTISKCQGDFRLELPAVCRHVWGIGGALRWSTEASPVANDCALEPNTVYFFNTTFMADPYDSSSSTCVSVFDPPVCSITLNHTSF